MSIEYRIGDATQPDPNINEIMLLWTDPPYGTGKQMTGQTGSYKDHSNTRYVTDAIVKWLPQMHPNGTICVCCDYRLAADITTTIRDNGWHYRGEIIWEFGLGRPRNTWWPVRHNNILTFTQTETSGLFDKSAIPRHKRLAPTKGYTDPTKPAGSVWEFTMSNTNRQRVGYPNQKPVELVEPFILAHTNPGDLVVDPFAGSGTTGVAALQHGRRAYLADISEQAYETMIDRFTPIDGAVA